MARSHPALVALLLVLLAAGAWLLVTVVNGVRLGVRDADPVLYWPATALIAGLAAGCLLGAIRVAAALRKPRGDLPRTRL